MKPRSLTLSGAAEPRGAVERPRTRHRQIRTVIVDDSPFFVACLECFLKEQEGFELVAVAETGLEAVERVAEFTPDLVLMDVRMPGMDGLEATGRIKAREGSPVVIIITLEDNAGARAAAKAAGADGFVAKAAGMDDGLRSAIRRAFRRGKRR